LTFRKSPVGALIVASIIRGYLPDYFSITFHLRKVLWCVRLTHPEGFRTRRAAAPAIYSDVFWNCSSRALGLRRPLASPISIRPRPHGRRCKTNPRAS